MHRCDVKLLVLAFLSGLVLALADDSLASNSRQSDVTGTHERDNNNNIKMRDKADEDEQLEKQLENSLLTMFGLSKRPRPSGKVTIPQHMIDLYKLQAGISEDLDIELSRRRIKRHPGNTIRSFYTDESLSGGEGSRTVESQHHMVRLYFNVTHIPDHEALRGAELRLFRRRANDSFYNLQTNQDFMELHPSINQAHRIDIYEIIRPSTPTSDAITRLIDTRYVNDLNKSKWESFDIQPAVHKWRSKPETNHGLQVQFRHSSGEKPRLKHVRLRRSTGISDTQWSVEQPLLIAYSDDGKGELTRRTKRNIQSDASEAEGDASNARNDPSLTEDERRTIRREERRRKKQEARNKKKRKNKCKRHPLYVDFKDVGWSDWIIAPPGYDAHYCHGECPFYLPDRMNTTNHAIVQTLIHSVNPQAAPSPCCVPTELSDIVLLYLDEFEKVVLKNYQGMMVEACGCR